MKESVKGNKNIPRVLPYNRGSDGFNGIIEMPNWSGTIVCSWGGGWEHVSVSPNNKHRTPSWDDMCYIKNLFWDEDECVVQYHPPKSDYINNMPNCLHLWKPVGREIEMPPAFMVGLKKGQTIGDVVREYEAYEEEREHH